MRKSARSQPEMPRPIRSKSAAPWTMYSALLGATGAEALDNVDQSLGSTYATLDVVGVQVIAEQMATGRLPVEVALLYEVPVLHFRQWMRDRISDDLLEEIKATCAEALQVKATLTLSSRLSTPAEASQAKALSERLAKISEALAPKDWNPARVETASDNTNVTIIMNGMGVDTSQGDVIDHAASPSDAGRTLVGGRDSDLQNDSAPHTPLPTVLDRVDPFDKMRAAIRSMSEGLDG